jgi:hypothetical protein
VAAVWPVGVAAGRPATGRSPGPTHQGSMRASTRRTVASAGGRQTRRSGSRRVPKRGQHWPGCVSGPFANRGQGSGTGQYRGDRHGQHRAECVPSATAVAWVGDLGEVVEQATVLVGCEHDRGVQPLAAAGIGMMRGQARRSEGTMGFDTRMIAGSCACSTSSPAYSVQTSSTGQTGTMPRPWGSLSLSGSAGLDNPKRPAQTQVRTAVNSPSLTRTRARIGHRYPAHSRI